MSNDEIIEQRSVIVPRVWPTDRYELRPYYTTESVRRESETLGLSAINLLLIRAMLKDFAELKEGLEEQFRTAPRQSCKGCGYTAFHSAKCAFPGFSDVKVGTE